MSKNLRGLSARKGLTENLFREIVKAGSSPESDREKLFNELSGNYLIGSAPLLSASSFYDFLDPDHIGKKVHICDGIACLTSGKNEKLKKALTLKFRKDEIGTVSCLGHCYTGSAVMIDNSIHHIEEPYNSDLKIIAGPPPARSLNTGTNARQPVLLPLTGDPVEYYGILKKYTSDISSAFREIELSALRGRGGAGFPLHLKLKISAEAQSDNKYVVANADEGDPGAFSDKWLLENRPHSILFGMLATGLIIGADTGVIYVRGEYPQAVEAVNDAIKQFENQKNKFEEILGREISFSFHVIVGAGAYICGEETSLLNSVEGLRPEVRTRPPFPATYGLFGKPTILCNVETFANLHFILREGGDAYSSMGSDKSKGTKLVSLDSGFRKPGLYEVLLGTPLGEVINEMGGGTKYPVKAFQIGGPLGGIVPSSLAEALDLDFESFTKAGFLLGHAGIVSIPERFPMMRVLIHLFEFVAKESCGKCFPCRLGSQRGFELLQVAELKGRKIDRKLFDDLLETLQLGSLCALGGGISLPVTNIMHYFGDELVNYFKHD